MIDYQHCTLNGRPAVEIFDARSGCPLAFYLQPVDARELCSRFERQAIIPTAIVAELRADNRA